MIAAHATSLRQVVLQQPARIAFGRGSRSQVAEFLKGREAGKTIVFASRSAAPLADDLFADLKSAGIALRFASPPPPEPTFDDARRAIEETEAASVDTVLALGGGSVIDIAKIAAACAGLGRDPVEFVGNGLLPRRGLTLVALPTTAGAGSEVSPNAIFLDSAAELKKGIISPWLIPDAAFVDPELARTLPPLATASTALDALSHCVEAFANKNAHPAVDLYAAKGAQLIFSNLPAAMENGDDIEARSALTLGSLYGGLCLGPVNTAAIHALSYPIGSRFHVAHGLANALLMPHVLRFNAETCPDRYAQLAAELGLAAEGDAVSRAESAVSAIERLCRGCGIPMRLSQCGVPREAIPDMARGAMQITRLLVNNLREVTQTDAESIYYDAY